MKRILKILGVFAVLLAIGTITCNWWLVKVSEPRIYHGAAEIPRREVAVVLGTAPRLASGPNPFFEARMNTAARLWQAKKVQHFVVSGDHGRPEYNEVAAMREALVRRGVPSSAITGDHAGFRTLDSILRARQVFGLARVTVVTDGWHLPRALFLAKSAGIDAIGACFEDVPWRASARTRVREWFSCVMAITDVYVLRTEPKFLGEAIRLPVSTAVR